MATYKFPNPNGGSMEVQATNFDQAKQKAGEQGWSASMGTFGVNSGPDVESSGRGSGGGGGGGGGGDTSGPLGAARSADAQLTALLQALSATNEQDFQERVREFNEQHALALQSFGLQQDAQKFSQLMQTSQLTGTFNGAPTEATREFNVTEGERERQFNVNTQADMTKLASTLTGPADYFRFLNATNNGRNIIGSLSGDTPRPQYGGFNGQLQPLTLSSIMDRLGIQSGASGGATGPMSTMQDGAAPTAQSMASGAPIATQGGATPSGGGIQLPNGMGSIPFPHQVNPSVWDSWGPTGQQFIKGAAAAAGFDPNEYERQINATRPGTMTAGPSGASAFSSGGQSAF